MQTLKDKAKKLKAAFHENKNLILKALAEENPYCPKSPEEIYHNLLMDSALDMLDSLYPKESKIRHIAEAQIEDEDFWKCWTFEWSILESMYLRRLKRGASFCSDEWRLYMSFTSENDSARNEFSKTYLNTNKTQKTVLS